MAHILAVVLMVPIVVPTVWLARFLCRYDLELARGTFAWSGTRTAKVWRCLPYSYGEGSGVVPVEVTARFSVVHFADGSSFETEHQLAIGLPAGTPLVIRGNRLGFVRVERTAGA